jgi:transposase
MSRKKSAAPVKAAEVACEHGQDPPAEEGLPEILRNAAGIDIGAGSHFVGLPPRGPGPHVHSFPAETYGLVRMAQLLRERGITHVAMEATGVYWWPVYRHLEEKGFTVRLLNPRSIKHVQAKKTDVKDCQWIQKLFSHGLGMECFVPDRATVGLRGLVRTRMTYVRSAATEVNRMHKALRLMNINLDRVVTDIAGKTGLSIIDAILDGERDPNRLAGLRDRRCRKGRLEIAACLDGVYAPHNLLELRVARSLYGSILELLEEIDLAIGEALAAFPKGDPGDGAGRAPDAGDRPRPKRSREKAEGVADALALVAGNGVDLTDVPGIGANLALTLISEIGTDMSRWPSAKEFASWAGLCPGSKVSGGKVLSSATRKVKSRAAHAFIMAAKGAARTQTSIGDFYRRTRARHGPQKALTATAHKILRIVYGMLRHGRRYEAVATDVERRGVKAKVLWISRQAAKLGMSLAVPEDSALEELVRSRLAASRG